MKVHILGICGTFMSGLAILAKALGHEVSGSDANVYPPMSTQLLHNDIVLHEGYSTAPLESTPDLVIIGNTLSRGNDCVEYTLNRGLAYTSGPQWLAETVLTGKHVIAVSGTHGKTTSASIVSWLLESAGENTGFLIGGVAENFGISARIGDSKYFVVEADEYDSAFFDKRSKFIHYRPRTLIINNIEYDHADIFGDIGDIRREFHRLIRTVPSTGKVIYHHEDEQIRQVFESGCWSKTVSFGADDAIWQVQTQTPDYSHFDVYHQGNKVGTVGWKLIGRHNAENALAAIAAADDIGLNVEEACKSLTHFKSVKRRLQRLTEIRGVTIYDDFAHHPSAIKTTLSALRAHVGEQRIIAVFEPRSNTMKLGVHQATLGPSLADANLVIAYQPADLCWDMNSALAESLTGVRVFNDTQLIIESLLTELQNGDHVVIMSNGGFENIHQRLITQLEN